MAVDNGRRIIDQEAALTINPEDNIIIDSTTNGTRKITYQALCAAVAETLGIADISAKANGAMQRTVYDADADGVVDNAEALEGHGASYFATASDLAAVSTVANGAMQKSVYDSNNNGVVDNAEKLGGNAASYYASQASVDTLSGDLNGKMDKSVYDSNGNGVVDNAEALEGHGASYFATASDLAAAETGIRNDMGSLSSLQTTDKSSLVAAINEAEQDAIAAAQTATDLCLSVVNGMLQVTYTPT